MSKFSSRPARANVTAPVKTTRQRVLTYEGHVGYEREPKSELFLLAVSNLVREDTFYEGASGRDQRFKALVHAVTSEDPEWVASFIPYLRDTMQMRSASVVMAAEYVAAGGPNGRRVVASALSRPDEPAELLAYWAQEYGRNFPAPIKRGVADAVTRLYTERAALKYDGLSRAWRMGDVIDVTHPKPTGEWQSNLFRWLLDTRHNRAEIALPDGCAMIAARAALEEITVASRREALDPETLSAAGLTWEALSGWLQGPMDAQAWEAVIPSMGYMALLRNLRNFEQAGVSGAVLTTVAARLADPEQVARSRQFPLRFLSAYRNITSERFAWPIEQALEHSVGNIPRLNGRTLILVDVSGSMNDRLSARSELRRWDAAALFGVALAKRCESARVIAYNTQAYEIGLTHPVMRTVEDIKRIVGGGTLTMQTLAAAYGREDRVVILTDEQAHRGPDVHVSAPVYTFNLGGYAPAHMQQGEKGSYVFGGLTDAGFTLLKTLDEMKPGRWPWEDAA